MPKRINFPIDFVISWVDENDSKWISKKNKYKKANDEARFRDYGTLKYVFRSIEKFAPWVHKVYLITDNQVPKWLNLDSDKVWNIVNY